MLHKKRQLIAQLFSNGSLSTTLRCTLNGSRSGEQHQQFYLHECVSLQRQFQHDWMDVAHLGYQSAAKLNDSL
jgi:hypothetical protein